MIYIGEMRNQLGSGEGSREMADKIQIYVGDTLEERLLQPGQQRAPVKKGDAP